MRKNIIKFGLVQHTHADTPIAKQTENTAISLLFQFDAFAFVGRRTPN
jgi:hypothetical protein